MPQEYTTLHEWRIALDNALASVDTLLSGIITFLFVNKLTRVDLNSDYKAEIKADPKCSNFVNEKGEAVSYLTAAKIAKEKGIPLPPIYRKWQATQTQLSRLQWDDQGNPVVKQVKGKDGKTRIAPLYKEAKPKGNGKDGKGSVTLNVAEVQAWFDTVRGKKEANKIAFVDFCARFDIPLTR